MKSALPLYISAVELMQTLECNAAAFFNREPFGDFPPRFALLALCANYRHEWLDAAVKGASAAISGRHCVRFRLRFHCHNFKPSILDCVNGQQAS
ncbi:MAG TPA: hypothetical protein VFC44_06480 [Candidatus Saccharimonadales bacterium]|nr:hypothetical protein [Candidatus Saccharimonadales bacterium]